MMIREALDSEADVPVKCNKLRGHIENAKFIQQKKREPSETE